MALEVTLGSIDEKVISQIIDNKITHKSDEENKFFEEYIKNKSSVEIEQMLSEKIRLEEVVDLLLKEETSDDGGIIALSGFYFQFLVSIEYLIELIQGKWEYLIIDHHQDIIVINNEKIRIIQVKTKNVEYCDVTETKLYREWIQKLFNIDKLFEEHSHKTEFELVTNFIVKNSSTVSVEIYHNNDVYDMDIQPKCFFEKIKQYSELRGDNNLLDDGYLTKLLSKFKISRKDSKDYFYKIMSNIGNLFSSRLQGTKEDVDFLIGYICSLCYYPSNPSVQIIDRCKSLRIKEELRSRFESDVRQYVVGSDSITKIDDYICGLHSIFSEAPPYKSLESYIIEFEAELKNSIKGSNNIYSMLSRYIERVYSSHKINITSSHSIDNSIKELLDLVFFIKLVSGGKVIIDDQHSKLLLKIIGNQKYSFFNLLDIDNFKNGISKFTDVFKACTFQEKRMLFNEEMLKLVFSGQFDDEDFPNDHIIELEYQDGPTGEDMRAFPFKVEKDSIAKVNYKVQIVNGSTNLKNSLLRKRTLPSLEEYKKYVGLKMR